MISDHRIWTEGQGARECKGKEPEKRERDHSGFTLCSME